MSHGTLALTMGIIQVFRPKVYHMLKCFSLYILNIGTSIPFTSNILHYLNFYYNTKFSFNFCYITLNRGQLPIIIIY